MGDGPKGFLTALNYTLILLLLSRNTLSATFGSSLRNITDWRRDVEGKEGYFTNTWAVEFDPRFERDVVSRIAKKHGFTLLGQIGDLQGHYHLRHDDVKEFNKLHNRDKTDRLLLEKEVKWAEQQKVLHRFKRDGVPNDPKFSDMWYMLNTGQTGGPAGVDINVLPVWKKGYTGKNVVISILDDGVDHTHPDLKPNYEPKASYDFNDMDPDPYPRDSDPDNCHGTRCAGEVAAVANNSVCGVGVAYNAKVGGVRMLDGKATDALEASSLSFSSQVIDVYSNCWGPKDDGKTFGKPGPLAAKSLQAGAEKGRGGKGNIFVWATGNGGLTDDDCNCDGYTTSIYTISIGCIGDHGLSAYYTELCSSTLAVTFNGGAHRERAENKMITTDLKHQCTEQFKGTSSAAPLAAGVIALMLEANSNLGWRDVQHIIVRTAKLTSPVDDGWKTNGAGFHFNHKFGFGRLDAEAMVDMAKTWKNVQPQRKCTGAASVLERDIPAGGALDIQIPTQACKGTVADISKLEHVVLTLSFIHRRRGDISVLLTSPSGTKNEILSTRRYDDSKEGLDNWGFMTVHCWGEDPKGFWNLKIIDNPMDVIGERVINHDSYGTLHTDTSKQETDVEDLEEQVIDDQTRQQQAKIITLKNQNPNFDFPYPSGVRRDRVKYLNSTEDSLATATEESIVDDLYNLTESDVASTTEFVYDRSTIEDPASNNEAPTENDNSDSGSGDYENFEYEAFLRTPNSKIRGKKFNKRLAKFEKLVRNKMSSRKTFKRSKAKKDATKKVQVAKEVAGTQRVQVNAGYENPEIPCLEQGCSGVLLKWVLTLYGT